MGKIMRQGCRFRNELARDVVGMIELAVVSRAAEPRLRNLVDKVFERLEKAGMNYSTLALTPVAAFGPFDAAWEGVTEATVSDRPLELNLVIGQRPDAWFAFTLQGVLRAVAADVWAVNHRALEIMSGLLATPDHPKAPWIADAIEAAQRSS